MSHTPRAPRAVPQRQAIGRRFRAHRLALGLTTRDLANHIGCGTYQVASMETVCRDVLLGTAIELAESVGLEVAVVPEYLLPLLDLTADETRALMIAASLWSDRDDDPTLHAVLAKLLPPALDKLTTTEEPTDA